MSITGPDSVLISVVIPVKNGDAWLDQTIPALLSQSLMAQTEIIVVDSGSTDMTENILKKYPVRVIKIKPSSFNHGTTRNLGVQEARGKYVLLTVQDAKPVSNRWLETMLSGFDDEKVAGVCGQQIVPHHIDNNPVQWYRPVSAPSVTKFCFPNRSDFDGLSPEQKKRICTWDNVNAMYRRDILIKIPFREVIFAEDIYWAKDALENGYALVYNNYAQVEHYHHESAESSFKRNLLEHYQVYMIFGIVPCITSDGLLEVLKNIKLLLKEDRVSFSSKLKWLKYNKSLRRAARLSDRLFVRTVEAGEQELNKLFIELENNNHQALKPRSSDNG